MRIAASKTRRSSTVDSLTVARLQSTDSGSYEIIAAPTPLDRSGDDAATELFRLNKFQELSAGLILLFSGEGPAAQRAGDALLADRITEAVEEGGFTSIDYGSWRKSDESVARLKFDTIQLARGPGTVRIAEAEMEVFSQALTLRRGDFVWTGAKQRWHFDLVEIARGRPFSRQLRVSALGLEPDPLAAATDCMNDNTAICALEQVTSAAVDRFDLFFRGRDRDAVVSLAWQAGPSCWIAWTPSGHGSSDLASWGRMFLAEPDRVVFHVAPAQCEQPVGAGYALRLPARREEVGPRTRLGGAEVLAAAPVLVQTLFGLIAESYAYLLE